jgi:hypothetical protein
MAYSKTKLKNNGDRASEPYVHLTFLEVMNRIPDTSFTETFLLKEYVSLFPVISISKSK